jgi:arsenite methyltransferase
MTGSTQPQRRGSYGIDAPYALGAVAIMIVVCLVMAIIGTINSGGVGPFLPLLFLLTIVAFGFHTTLRGKFTVWTELLDKLGLQGDERILDLGCGRGAVLLLAAQHLTTGQAVGVDLWRRVDQSGNCAEATWRNAVAEGVADRVELHTADMTALPFEDNSFDVVVSSLAIHNLRGRVGRAKAVEEAVRVLRPGGRLLIADLRGTRQHEAHLARIGMSDVGRHHLGWRFWWGGPWAPTRLVTATKPARRT